MIDELMAEVIKKVPEKYPHLQHPQILKAKVAGASEAGEWEEYLKIEDENGIRDCKLIHKKYRYVLQIIDDSGNRDTSFPSIPAVVSGIDISVGNTVVIALVRGFPDPYILGVDE